MTVIRSVRNILKNIIGFLDNNFTKNRQKDKFDLTN